MCPKSVIPAWEDTFKAQGVDYYGVINYESLRTGKTGWGSWDKATTSRPARTKKGAFVFPDDLEFVVWDESHYCQGVNSQNAEMMVAAHGRLNLLLSATAAEDPTELRAAGYLLGLHSLSNYTLWAKKMNCGFDNWGKLKFKKTGSAEALAKIRDHIYPDRGHKIKRSDISDLFRKTAVFTTPLFFDDRIEELYAEMEAEIEDLKARGVKPNPLVHLLRQRQEVELLKVPVTRELIDAELREGHHVVVFANFDQTLESLAAHYPGCPIVRGSNSKKERERFIKEFAADKHPVMLCNIKAGGVGVSLHDQIGNHPRTALIFPTWDAKELIQALGRVDRAGSATDSIQRILFAAGTVEERVAAACERKLNNLETLHDVNMTAIEEPQESVDHASRAHARYSPSSLKLFEACPHYLNDDEDSGDNEAALRGTRIHEAVETRDLSHCKSEREVGIAEMLIAKTDEILEEYGMLNTVKAKRYTELRMEIKAGRQETFGTCDFVGVRGDVAVAIDYKTGYMEVDDAQINAQVQSYTLGIFQKFPEVKVVHFYLLIPMQDEISYGKFTREDHAEQIELRISTIIERALNPGDTYNPGLNLCEFCGNRAKCQALAEKALEAAKKYAETDPFPLPEKVHGSDITDPVEIADLLRTAIVLEKWAKGVRKRANEIAVEEGWDLPGFNKIEIKTKTKCESVSGAWALMKKKFPKLTLDEFFSACSGIKTTDLGDIIGTYAPRGQKGKMKEETFDLMRDEGILSGGNSTTVQLRQDRNWKPQQ